MEAPSEFPGNSILLRQALRRPSAIAAIFAADARMLSKRGLQLAPGRTEIGRPLYLGLRIGLPRISPAKSAKLFYGILAASLTDFVAESTLPLRLRVPVDLRRYVGSRNLLGNVTTAVPIELSPEERQRGGADVLALGSLISAKIQSSLKADRHWSTVIEGWAASKVLPTRAIAAAVKDDLLSAKRTSTMTATFLGVLDKYVQDLPFDVSALRCSIPTLGCVGYLFRNCLHIDLTLFEGLLTQSEVQRYIGCVERVLRNYSQEPSCGLSIA